MHVEIFGATVFMKGAGKPPPPPLPPAPTDAADEAKKSILDLARKRRQGYAGTILTSAQGVSDYGQKSILGG